jgi:hypothetical protein
VQGGGALALVAAVAVSVAALTGGGGSGPGGTNRVEAASAGTDTSVSTPVSHVTTVPTTVAPAPDTTVAPAPTPETTPAAVVEQAPSVAPQTDAPVQPASPSTFTLSGNVSGNPADTSVQLQITGPGGTRTFNVDAAGNYSVSGLEAGDYTVIWTWSDSTNTATRAEKFGTVSISGDSSASFTFSE